MDIDNQIALEVARAALAAHNAMWWLDEHHRKCDSPLKQVEQHQLDAQEALTDACDYAQADDDGRKVTECADKAERSYQLCMAASKAANEVQDRMTAAAEAEARNEHNIHCIARGRASPAP